MISSIKRLTSAIMITLMILGSIIVLDACTSPKNEAFSGESKATEAPETAEAPVPAEDEPAADSNSPSCRIVTIGGTSGGSYHGLAYDYSSDRSAKEDESRTGETRTVEFAGKEYDIVYKETASFVIGDYTVDRYGIVTDDSGTAQSGTDVSLLPDGTLGSIWVFDGSLAQITPKDNMTHEEMLAAVADVLKDEVDFSRFEYSKVFDPDPENAQPDYTLVWYNETNGLEHDDSIGILMDVDGNICRVLVKNRMVLGLDEAPELKLDDYLPAIEAKLSEIYGEVKSYSFRSTMLTVIEGSPCIFCKGDVEFAYNGETETDLFQFAVIPEN